MRPTDCVVDPKGDMPVHEPEPFSPLRHDLKVSRSRTEFLP